MFGRHIRRLVYVFVAEVCSVLRVREGVDRHCVGVHVTWAEDPGLLHFR